MKSQSLRQILTILNVDFADLPDTLDLEGQVTRVTSDSRQVISGTLFVALKGGQVDGHQYISDAFKQGALLAVGHEHLHASQGPYLRVSDPREFLGRLAAAFYGQISKNLLCIAVTGTSGKTTTSYLIESILKASGYRVGVIGTISFRYGTKIFPSTHTTPGVVELHQLLFEMKEAGCNAVVMEVSSHALRQGRVEGIAFDGMLFTNLSPEHLDFHADMEDYFQAKAILFRRCVQYSISSGKDPVCIVNGNDRYGKRLLHELDLTRTKAFGLSEHLTSGINGIHGQIDEIQVDSKMTGQFNSSNISAAVRLAQKLKIPAVAIAAGISSLVEVPGRLEKIENELGLHIWVDYAHKPDALENVLNSLNEIRGSNRLITVIGCGGDRDKKKRPMMGKIATQSSCHVFITSDNPRTEDPNQIIKDILLGIETESNYTVEVDRAKAIHDAIHMARPGDLILIAGKGHESYQVIGRRKIHFDDREIARLALASFSAGKPGSA